MLKHELLFEVEEGIKAQHTKQSETNQNEKRDEVLILKYFFYSFSNFPFIRTLTHNNTQH
jgi:hypothetical protein